MSRPNLSTSLSARDFLDFYWLKNELVAFCRANNLPTSGSKAELTERITHFLSTGEVPASPQVRQPPALMPHSFTRETVIQSGWRCSQELRQFFEQELGSTFHFNSFMRDYITENGVGHSLDEAIAGWRESKSKSAGSRDIGKQFEYNQFTRDYFKANPHARREDVIREWKKKRSKRASEF